MSGDQTRQRFAVAGGCVFALTVLAYAVYRLKTNRSIKCNGRSYEMRKVIVASVVTVFVLGGTLVLVGVVAIQKGAGTVAPPQLNLNKTNSNAPSSGASASASAGGAIVVIDNSSSTNSQSSDRYSSGDAAVTGAFGKVAVAGASMFGIVVFCLVSYRLRQWSNSQEDDIFSILCCRCYMCVLCGCAERRMDLESDKTSPSNRRVSRFELSGADYDPTTKKQFGEKKRSKAQKQKSEGQKLEISTIAEADDSGSDNDGSNGGSAMTVAAAAPPPAPHDKEDEDADGEEEDDDKDDKEEEEDDDGSSDGGDHESSDSGPMAMDEEWWSSDGAHVARDAEAAAATAMAMRSQAMDASAFGVGVRAPRQLQNMSPVSDAGSDDSVSRIVAMANVGRAGAGTGAGPGGTSARASSASEQPLTLGSLEDMLKGEGEGEERSGHPKQDRGRDQGRDTGQREGLAREKSTSSGSSNSRISSGSDSRRKSRRNVATAEQAQAPMNSQHEHFDEENLRQKRERRLLAKHKRKEERRRQSQIQMQMQIQTRQKVESIQNQGNANRRRMSERRVL